MNLSHFSDARGFISNYEEVSWMMSLRVIIITFLTLLVARPSATKQQRAGETDINCMLDSVFCFGVKNREPSHGVGCIEDGDCDIQIVGIRTDDTIRWTIRLLHMKLNSTQRELGHFFLTKDSCTECQATIEPHLHFPSNIVIMEVSLVASDYSLGSFILKDEGRIRADIRSEEGNYFPNHTLVMLPPDEPYVSFIFTSSDQLFFTENKSKLYGVDLIEDKLVATLVLQTQNDFINSKLTSFETIAYASDPTGYIFKNEKSQNPQKSEKPKSGRKWIIALIVVLVILLIAICITACYCCKKQRASKELLKGQHDIETVR